MRMPTFSRQSGPTTQDERPTVVSTGTAPVRTRTDAPPAAPKDSTVARPTGASTTEFPTQQRHLAPSPKVDDRERAADPSPKTATEPVATEPPVIAGPKPRASLVATLSLIFAVAGALLTLSGPLTGYGVGVAGLALVLSLIGLRATRRRHVAGKTDAVIALVVSLGAIVLGVLALNGSLSWAGTDVDPVTSLRNWLDSQFTVRF
ncbi:MAG: hypothetical protein QOC94_412 [Actinoplanes sp.]|nr:hypothetical protein [Actinoplanes sp.]